MTSITEKHTIIWECPKCGCESYFIKAFDGGTEEEPSLEIPASEKEEKLARWFYSNDGCEYISEDFDDHCDYCPSCMAKWREITGQTYLDELMTLLAAKPDFAFIKVKRSFLEGIAKEMRDVVEAYAWERGGPDKDVPNGPYRQP